MARPIGGSATLANIDLSISMLSLVTSKSVIVLAHPSELFAASADQDI
jgi:hypothetical protein